MFRGLAEQRATHDHFLYDNPPINLDETKKIVSRAKGPRPCTPKRRFRVEGFRV